MSTEELHLYTARLHWLWYNQVVLLPVALGMFYILSPVQVWDCNSLGYLLRNLWLFHLGNMEGSSAPHVIPISPLQTENCGSISKVKVVQTWGTVIFLKCPLSPKWLSDGVQYSISQCEIKS